MSTTEHPYTIDEAIRNGLPPDAVQVNAPYMDDLHNFIPFASGARSVFRPTTPLGGVTAWPLPAILRDERTTIQITEDGISELSEDLQDETTASVYQAADPDTLFEITGDGAWTLLAIHGDWFLCNGTCLVFKIRGGGGLWLGVNGVNCVGRSGDRLLISVDPEVWSDWFESEQWGRVFAAWKRSRPLELHITQGVNVQMIVYSERGGGAVDVAFHPVLAALGFFGLDVFDRLEEVILDRVEKKQEIGIAFLRTPGKPTRMLRDGKKAVVYGTNGVSALVPEGAGMEEQEFPESFGAITAGGVDGHHLALLTDGSLGLYAGGNFRRLMFKRWIDQCGAPVVISYDKTWGDFWICGPDGAYVLNADGRLGGPIDFSTPSLFRHDGDLVAVTTVPEGNIICEARTARFDYNERDSKHAVLVQLHDDDLKKRLVRIEFIDDAGDWKNGPTKSVGPDSVGFLDTSFRDGRLYYKGEVLPGREGHLYAAEVRLQSEGERFRRGTKASPA